MGVKADALLKGPIRIGAKSSSRGNAQTAQTPRREFLDHEKFNSQGLEYNQLDTAERAVDE
jgi:hypothetical protein